MKNSLAAAKPLTSLPPWWKYSGFVARNARAERAQMKRETITASRCTGLKQVLVRSWVRPKQSISAWYIVCVYKAIIQSSSFHFKLWNLCHITKTLNFSISCCTSFLCIHLVMRLRAIISVLTICAQWGKNFQLFSIKGSSCFGVDEVYLFVFANTNWSVALRATNASFSISIRLFPQCGWFFNGWK